MPGMVDPNRVTVLNETDTLEGVYRELPSGAPGVTCLWIRTADYAPVRVLPDACVDLVWREGQGAFVAGPDTGPVLSTSPPGTALVGVRFGPGAGGPALGHPLSDLRDLRVGLAELSPAVDRELPGDLDPQEALRRLAALATRLAPPDPAVAEAARRLDRPGTRVTTLAADLGFSERQLRRRFDASVGYGPKVLDRVLRLRRFLTAGDDADLAGAAIEAGYADQAHLTRECARLTGLTPAALLRSR
jgi:AraC-like DNA-binding protein